MVAVRELLRRIPLPGTTSRRRIEREIREEIQTHIDLRTADSVAAGMSPAAARRDAEQRFGDPERIVRSGRAIRSAASSGAPLGTFPFRPSQSPRPELMRDLIHDLKLAARGLIHNPGFAVVAILSLALGIGFNTTMFAVIDAVLFKPIPVADSGSLVRLRKVSTVDRGPLDDIIGMMMSYPDYLDIRDQAEVFSGIAAYRNEMTGFNNRGSAEFLFGESVTANYFDVLGIRPLVGRSFAPDEDDDPGGNFVFMVAEAVWRGHLGSEPEAIGKEYLLGGRPFTLIGVVPQSYSGATAPIVSAFYVPISVTDLLTPGGKTSRLERRGGRNFYTVARLRDGATIEQANARVAAIGRALAAEYPESHEGIELSALPANDVRIAPSVDHMMMPVAGVLMAVVGLILLIACANVANMMLARASTRSQEIGIRLALGAGRGRLVRLLLTESVLISAIGGALAVLLAYVTLRLLSAVQPPVGVPIALDIEVDPRVFAFTAVVALLTGIVFGLVPALRSTRTDLTLALKGDDARVGTGSSQRLRGALVVVQVAVSLVLLIGAALLIRSLANASRIDPGIATESIVSVNLALMFQGYDAQQAAVFHQEALERIAALPGIDAVAFAERLPLESTIMITREVWVENRQIEPGEGAPSIMSAVVSPAYFDVMSIRMRAGRSFGPEDRQEGPGVAIVNEVMAEQLWPGENPLGKRFATADPEGPFLEVIGVNAPHKISTLGEDPTPHFYLPHTQVQSFGFGTLVARAPGNLDAALEAIRRVVVEIDPNLAVMQAKTIAQHMSLSLFPIRLAAMALGILGVLGALLAAVGVYGVIAFAVVRRRREIGIRIAVGANPGEVITLILRQGMRLVLIGAGIGVFASLGMTRALRAMLYGIGAADAMAFGGAVLVLLAVAVVANLVPAVRAARVDPVAALRTQ